MEAFLHTCLVRSGPCLRATDHLRQQVGGRHPPTSTHLPPLTLPFYPPLTGLKGDRDRADMWMIVEWWARVSKEQMLAYHQVSRAACVPLPLEPGDRQASPVFGDQLGQDGQV